MSLLLSLPGCHGVCIRSIATCNHSVSNPKRKANACLLYQKLTLDYVQDAEGTFDDLDSLWTRWKDVRCQCPIIFRFYVVSEMIFEHSLPRHPGCRYQILHAIENLTEKKVQSNCWKSPKTVNFASFSSEQIAAQEFGAALALCGDHVTANASRTSGHRYPSNCGFCSANAYL